MMITTLDTSQTPCKVLLVFRLISYHNSSCLSPATCFCTAPHGSFIPASLASPANRLPKKQSAQSDPSVFGGDGL